MKKQRRIIDESKLGIQASHRKSICPICGNLLAFHRWGFACQLTKGKGDTMANKWTEKTAGSFNDMHTFVKKGDELIGKYQGSREAGEGLVHTFDVSGKMIDTWGKGKLNYLLKGIEKNTLVKIVYMGMAKNVPIKIGKRTVKKDIHDFQLFTSD